MWRESVASGPPYSCRTGGRRPSRLRCQPLHNCLGHGAAQGGQFRGRHRRFRYASNLGFLLFSFFIGGVLDQSNAKYGVKDYLIPYIIAGSAYLVATAIIHVLLPRLEPIAVDAAEHPLLAIGLTTEK